MSAPSEMAAPSRTRSPSEEVVLWRDIREKGSMGGMLFTILVWRFLGRWMADVVLRVVVVYFFLKDGRMRQVSRQYLQKVNRSSSPGWKEVYQHYLSFARTSLDRFDVWSGRLRNYDIHYQGEEHLIRLHEAGRGAILIGAHMGSFDMLRVLGKRRGGKIHILTDRRNSRKFSKILRRFCPHIDEGVAEYDAGSIDTVFDLKKAVERGEFVGLLGDRIASESLRGAARVSPAVFLGDKALFPQAPFIFAAHLDCPVLLLFGLRRADRAYDLYVEPFADRIDFDDNSREEVLARCAAAYAARLEHYCRQYPLQWFNFYDFWGTADSIPLPSRERIKVRDGPVSDLQQNQPSSQPSPLKGEGAQ